MAEGRNEEKETQEISGNSLGGETRQPEPKTKDWFSLFHEGDTLRLKRKRSLVLQAEVTFASNLFLGPNSGPRRFPL